MSNIYEAKRLKDEFPEETKGFTIFEIEEIWTEYSEKSAASWLIPTNKHAVDRVFSYFRD